MTRGFFSILLALVLITSFGLVQAATVRSDQDSLTVAGSDQPKDLYLAAPRISIDRSISGDLAAAGKSILINSEVEDSVLAAAGDIAIRSVVGRHARVVAGTVIVSGKIDGDLLAAGEVIELTETAEIGGDLLLAGRRVIINGRVKGVTKIVADDVTLNGPLGSVTVWTDQLSVGARANLSGELSYHAPTVAKLDPLANLGGGVKFSQTSSDKRPGRLASGYWWLTILGSILAILAMLKFLPRTANHLVGQYHKNWMLVLAIGLLSIIITPIIAVIFLFSGLGAPLGLILIALWLTLAVLAAVVGKLILGAWLIRLLGRQPTAQLDWRSAVAGVLALAILSFLPGVGALAWFVVWLSGLGSLVLLLKRVDTLGANE